MMQRPIAVLSLMSALLAGCSAPVPDSGAGVGFQDYTAYNLERERERERALSQGGIVGASVGTLPLGADAAAGAMPGGFSTERLGAAIDAADPQGGSAAAFQSGAVIGAPLSAMDTSLMGAAQPVLTPAPALEPTLQVQPGFKPTASKGSSGTNIVQFALSTTHAVGTPMYPRTGLKISNVAAACGKFPSSDQAQEAFLAAGGPQQDRKGLDPDGDGYACGWNPAPFRAALN